jgi:hypothetical protein
VEDITVTEGNNLVLLDQPDHGTLDIIPGTDDLQYNPDVPAQNDFFALGNMFVTVLAEAATGPSTSSNDTYTLDEDADIVVDSVEGVLWNDIVAGDDPIVNLIGGPVHGDLLLDDDGSLVYLPDPDFNGEDIFVYDFTDSLGTSNVSSVTLIINSINDAPDAVDDTFDGFEDVDVVGNVLTNDVDVDGDVLTALKLTDPANGVVTVGTDGAFTYTPNAGYSGPDSFTYQADDGNGGTDTATVTLDILANQPPDAVDDDYVLPEDSAMSGNVSSNDTDPESDPLTFTKLTDPANGEVVFSADGTFTYTPNLNYNGPDSFTYQADDDHGGTDSATVSFDVTPVNDPPVAVDDGFEIDEDTILNGNVLTNDTDVENDTLTATLVNDVSNGSLNLNSDGTFTYTPDPNWNGRDTFTYQVSDGNGGTDTTTVVIDVLPVNDAPDVVDDTYAVVQNRTFKVKASAGILANDSDIEGDPMAVTVVDSPANGRLVMKRDGGFIFRPDRNYVGSDSFTYTVNDGVDDSVVATVTLNIGASNVPVARGDLYEFPTGVLGDMHTVSPSGGTLSNDYFVAPGDVLTGDMSANIVDDAIHGTVTLRPDGSFDYVLTENFEGLDAFTYFARDEDLGVNSEPVVVTLLVNAIPAAPAVVGDIAALDAYLAEEVDEIVEEIIGNGFNQDEQDEYFSQLAWAFSPKSKPNDPIPEYQSYYDYIQSLYE